MDIRLRAREICKQSIEVAASRPVILPEGWEDLRLTSVFPDRYDLENFVLVTDRLISEVTGNKEDFLKLLVVVGASLQTMKFSTLIGLASTTLQMGEPSKADPVDSTNHPSGEFVDQESRASHEFTPPAAPVGPAKLDAGSSLRAQMLAEFQRITMEDRKSAGREDTGNSRHIDLEPNAGDLYLSKLWQPPRPAAASAPAPAMPPAYAPALPPLPPQTPAKTEATLVQVFYATDRMQTPSFTDVKFGRLRSFGGSLHYGRCEVSIPKGHKMGKLETPSILRLEFRPNLKKHIVLSSTSSLAETEFFERVRESTAKSSTKDAFVFIHGYNVSFEDAARRTGQIAFDLDFVGAPIFYSWPSNGKTEAYLKDETNITWSTPHLQKFLEMLAHNAGAEKIHIIAHSMGNRAVCDALKALSYDKASQLRFNHLLLAAPDIDAETFRELAASLQRLCAHVTLYESSGDKALHASKKIHGNPRAGEPLLVIRGMDTIDASAIDTDFLGHSYFSDTWPLLSDFHAILFDDKPASGRFGLTPVDHQDGRYYAFKR